MLDWNSAPEIQQQGRMLAKTGQDLTLFLQPMFPKYNKNTWDNCAIIFAECDDDRLKPYLIKLLEWLKDLNWPGAFCIFDRIVEFNDTSTLLEAINICINKARVLNDEIWEYNMNMIIESRK